MLYNRYIVKNIAVYAVFSLVCLSGIVWLSQSLKLLDMVLNKGVSVMYFFYLSFLMMPYLVEPLLPVAFFIATVFTYNRMYADNEMVILESSGISRAGLSKPALKLALIVTTIGYLVSMYLLPLSYQKFREMYVMIRNIYASSLLQEEVFNNPAPGLTIYVRESDRNGNVKGVLIHDERNIHKATTLMADEGTILKGDDRVKLILKNGNKQEVNKEDEFLSLLNFAEYTLDFNINDKDGPIFRKPKPQELFIDELFKYEGDKKNKFIAEAHRRITWPLYAIILALISTSCLVTGQFSRRGKMNNIIMAGILAVLMIVTGLVIHSMISKHPIMIPLLYLNLVLFGGVSLYKLR